MKLTKSTIDSLEYEGDSKKNERCIYWADSPSGLGLRVYPSGKKAFVLSYRFEGTKQLKTIGKYGDITLKQAEDIARKDHAALIEGKNPLTEKRKGALGDTVVMLCNAYMERHASTKKTGSDDQRRINQHLLPAWKNRKIKSITREDVALLHRTIGAHAPYEANRTLALISVMFSKADIWGMVEAGHQNPAKGIAKYKEVARDRFLSEEELPRLMEAIDQEPNQSARFAFWMYLLTGLRREELLSLKWSDIDQARAEARIDNTKNGTTHYQPLTSEAMALLEAIPRQSDNPYIFIGKTPGQRIVNIGKAWSRVKKAAVIDDIRIHDLRRTVGSWLAQSGNSLHLIGRILNHKNSKTTEIYARFGQNHAREALDRQNKKVFFAAGIRQPGEVIDIAGQKN